ncbi:right-handed parallel beta-helix repeat-containing protein [Bacillus sp. FJAT-28004]|uniref:right-handed parallel beta-helix repeat-containing protein n=1 Tax=Bacillus sp. FJAT-28004 TaxID=1679165 RepID=UPI0006B67E4A|nr:right-handed parallel beta-helix repeat-containing protein [Bacillus sp. FJAT-28004]
MKTFTKCAISLLLSSLLILTMFVGIVPVQTVSAAVQNSFYVSTAGSDTTGDGSLGSPWATIQKARDYIRTNGLNTNMTGDIDVYIAAGDYYVDSTITFNESDSGSNGYSIKYKNKDEVGSAHFIGGQPITNWTQHSGNIYKAYVGTGWTFETLYENGKRAWKARYPNKNPGSSFKASQADYLSSEGVYSSRTVLQYKAGDLNPTSWNLSEAQVYIWSGDYWDWFTDTVPISSINTTTRQITLQQSTRYPINQTNYHKDGSRYYIQGVQDLLDQPGEFYLDSSSGYVYYNAMDGAIGSQTIIAPKVKRVISLIGSSETNLVHDIHFDGLSMEVSDFTDWYRYAWVTGGDSGESHTYPAYDRVINMTQHRTGMLYMENTMNISILNNHFKNSGYSAIYMLFYNKSNLVKGNLIEHTGYSGIYLEGRYPGEGDVSRDNVLSNNLIHDVGELVGHASGISLINSGHNEVSYSEIYNSPRTAVTIYGYVGIPNADLYAHDNVIKNLKIYNMTQDSGDTGALYAFSTSLETSTTYNVNTFEQITIDNSRGHSSMTDYAPNGVFMDGGTGGTIFSNIKVTNSQWNPYRTQTNSPNQVLTNVSWKAGFNDSLMDYANIGIKNDFPYAVAPTGLSSASSGSQINLSWQGVKNAVSYDVMRSTVQGGPYTTTVCSAVTSTSCIDTAVTLGTTYYYVVVARTSIGLVSDFSNESAKIFGGLVNESFENGVAIWNSMKGTASTSTAPIPKGNSYVLDQDTDVITHTFSSNQNKVLTLWFYDNADNTNMQVFTKVDNAQWDNGSLWRGLGVATGTSTTKYAYRVNSTIRATEVDRTTGWHEFTFDYTSGTKVDMYIDGEHVSSEAGITSFNQVSMGDWWTNSLTGNVYFDDVNVTDAPLFDKYDFESGLGNWSSSKGTASTSTAPIPKGNSYVLNEDTDVITHTFSSNQNKVLTLWFYDNAANTNMQVFTKVDNAQWDNGSLWRGIGVATGTSTTKYAYRVNSTIRATEVDRTTGWHEFKFDYTSGTKVDMYIDGELVSSEAGITSFNQVSMGDWWANRLTGNVYFDDVKLQ